MRGNEGSVLASPASGSLRPGTVLDGRYQILSPLGIGGMGRIWEAEDLRLERRVAVKVLRASLSHRRGPRSRFAREAKLLARLDPPGVVRLYEAVTDGEVHYLVTQLVDGESLADLILGLRRQLAPTAPWSPSRLGSSDLVRLLGRPAPQGVRDVLVERRWCCTVTRITVEIARALEAVHGFGVIHRDIKGSNVMLKGGGHPVLIDFGLGGDIGDEGDPGGGVLSGNLRCLAPEQARRMRMGDDPRTDVYQLGLLLYELMTLQEPFPGLEAGEVLERVRRGRFRRPRELDPGLPSALEDICLKAMARDPDSRYQTAGALRQDLETFAARPSGGSTVRRLVAWTLGLGSPQARPGMEMGLPARGV